MISHLEQLLLIHIKAVKLQLPEAEYRFHHKRKWRFDFAYPDYQLSISN